MSKDYNENMYAHILNCAILIIIVSMYSVLLIKFMNVFKITFIN